MSRHAEPLRENPPDIGRKNKASALLKPVAKTSGSAQSAKAGREEDYRGTEKQVSKTSLSLALSVFQEPSIPATGPLASAACALWLSGVVLGLFSNKTPRSRVDNQCCRDDPALEEAGSGIVARAIVPVPVSGADSVNGTFEVLHNSESTVKS